MKGNDNSTAGAGAFGGIDRLAFLLALGPFAVITGLGSVVDVLPEISTSLCATGLAVSVFFLVYAVQSPIISSLSPRRSSR
jgi:predicted MFS family arabinose efflux permease